MTGHLLGAAGAAESIAAILAIRNSLIPPTINQFELDPEIDSRLDFTFHKAKQKEVNYALSNTFGFGGHNASIIFKKIKWYVHCLKEWNSFLQTEKSFIHF